jgi:hypothetical protein
MKLKKYLEFIKESIKEDIEEQSIWKVTEDDIQDYLRELEDEGYIIEVEFGFCQKVTQYHYNKPSTEKDVFTEKVLAGDSIRPSYWIRIFKSEGVSNEDVSDCIKFAYSIIKEKADADISIHDGDGDIGDIEGIQIKGGLFFTDNWNSSEPELLEADDYISLFVKQKEVVKFTQADLVDYYEWESGCEVKGDNIYIHVDIEDMADVMLSRKSDYKDILINGEESMYDNYYGSDYQPDTQSMFQYSLTKENGVLLVKAMIKEVGGLENLINHIGDEWSDEAYESVKGKSEEEVIDFLLKERFYTTLKQLCKDSEICQEVKQTIGDWEMNAHVDKNYKQILDEFDEIVEKEFKFTKEEKEVTKYYTSKDAEGNQIKREYKKDVTFYIIQFSNDWTENTDVEYLKGRDLVDLFKEYCSNEMQFNYNMDPYFSDYGDVDRVALNKDINSDLNRYLSK